MTIEMKKQIFPASITKAGETSRRFTFRISTGSPDRDRDVIDPKGWRLDSYKKNPVVLFAHDYKNPPVAKTVEIAVTRDGLDATCEFPPPGVYPLADTIHGLVQNGMLKAASVGFKPLKSEYNHERKGLDIHEAELLEWSVVPVGANSDALLLKCVGIGCLDEKAMNRWLGGSCGCHEDNVLPSAPSQVEYAVESLSRTLAGHVANTIGPAAWGMLDDDLKDADLATVNTMLGETVSAMVVEAVTREVHRAICYHTGRVD